MHACIENGYVCGARSLQPSDTFDTGNLPFGCLGAAPRMVMASEVVASTYHHTETLFKYLKTRTPKMLIVSASGNEMTAMYLG
jgi:hypothetical protein